MQSTFKIKEEKLLQFQQLVKSFDLRFVRNPFLYNGKATVCIDGTHLPMEKCNEFFAAWKRMNTEIREIPQKTKTDRLIARLKRWI